MRRHDDPSQVQLAAESAAVPVAFRWRRRRYVVVEVQREWVETAAWWLGSTAPAGSAAPGAAEAFASQRSWWRVAARRSGTPTVGVFDLCDEAGRWRVRRVLD